MHAIVRIGNAGGFWGDRVEAAAELVRQQLDLDYLTIDYLAEVSMSILARQKERDPSLGYPSDFLESLRMLAPVWSGADRSKRSRLRLVTNAGGLNPRGCAQACRELLRAAGCRGL